MAGAGAEGDAVVIADRAFVLTDIEGSTALWERYATVMDDVLRRHDDLIEAAVVAAGGRMIRSKGEGDSTFSVFSEAQAALDAAIAAQRALLAEPWPASIRVRVRIGVHAGECIERDGEFYGTTVNRAARIRGLASGGQVLVSEAVAMSTAPPPDVSVVEIGKVSLRGLGRPEPLFAVDDPVCHVPTAVAIPPVPPSLRPSGVFIGRDDELLDAVTHAEKVVPTGGTVVVIGEAGLGKSALVARVLEARHADGAVVLGGTCTGDADPYGPFRDVVRDAVHLGRDAAHGAHSDHDIGVAAVTGVGGGAGYEADGAAALVADAVRHVLSAAAVDHPVVVAIEDLHAASSSTRSIVANLVAAPVPGLALLVSSRESIRTGPHTLVIEMKPLANEQVRALVAAFAVGEPGATDVVTSDAVQALTTATNGSPFAITRILESLPDIRSAIHGSADHIVGGRLDELSSEVRRVLDVAAVAGTRFSVREIADVAGDEAPGCDLVAALDRLVDVGFLVDAGPGVYCFAHDLVLGAVRAQLAPAHRAALHARLAARLAAMGARDELILHHELLAIELGSADAVASDSAQLVDVAERALRVADAATARLAIDEAAALLDRTTAALDVSLPAPARTRLALATADARRRRRDVQGERERARAAATFAADTDDPDLLADVATSLALHGTIGVADETTEEFCRHALLRIPAAAAGARSRVYSALAFHDAVYAGRNDSGRAFADEALALARAAADDRSLALALSTAAAARVGAPDVDAQLALGRELRAIAIRTGDATLAARALRIEGPVQLQGGHRGAFDSARRRLRELGEQFRNWFWIGTATQWDAMDALMDGDHERAERHANALLTNAHVDPDVVNVYGAQLLLIREGQGRLAEVLPIAIAAVTQNPGLLAFRIALAAAHAELGDVDEARSYFAPFAADAFASVPSDVSRSGSLALLAQAAAVVATPDEARTLHDLLLPFEGQLVVLAAGIACLGAADRFLGMLAARSGAHGEARDRFDAALALEQAISAPALVERTEAARAASYG